MQYTKLNRKIKKRKETTKSGNICQTYLWLPAFQVPIAPTSTSQILMLVLKNLDYYST